MKRIIGIIPLIFIILLGLMLVPRFDPTLTSLQHHFSTNNKMKLVHSNETIVLFPAQKARAYNYRNCVNVAVSTSGIYFHLDPPFGILLKPILIPWSEIKAYSLTSWRGSVDTNVWIPLAGVEISFKQSAKEVSGHCKRLNIPKVESLAMQRLRMRGA